MRKGKRVTRACHHPVRVVRRGCGAQRTVSLAAARAHEKVAAHASHKRRLADVPVGLHATLFVSREHYALRFSHLQKAND